MCKKYLKSLSVENFLFSFWLASTTVKSLSVPQNEILSVLLAKGISSKLCQHCLHFFLKWHFCYYLDIGRFSG